jgi:hypothetical protein
MLNSVPIREVQTGGGQPIRYVLASDIPPEIGKRFMRDVAPCACPSVGDEQDFYAHDWERWCRGNFASKPD